MFLGAFLVAHLVSAFHELLSADGEPTALTSVEFLGAVVGEYAAAFKAVVRCHLEFCLRSSKAKSC